MSNYISWILMICSLIGGFFVSTSTSKYRFMGFIIWTIVDIGLIAYFVYLKQYAFVVMYSVYIVQAILGLKNNWNK